MKTDTCISNYMMKLAQFRSSTFIFEIYVSWFSVCLAKYALCEGLFLQAVCFLQHFVDDNVLAEQMVLSEWRWLFSVSLAKQTAVSLLHHLPFPETFMVLAKIADRGISTNAFVSILLVG